MPQACKTHYFSLSDRFLGCHHHTITHKTVFLLAYYCSGKNIHNLSNYITTIANILHHIKIFLLKLKIKSTEAHSMSICLSITTINLINASIIYGFKISNKILRIFSLFLYNDTYLQDKKSYNKNS